MKKIWGIGLLALLLQSCSDGDLVYKNLNFNENGVQKCSTKSIYYNVNGKEILILDLATDLKESDFALQDTKELTLDNTNRVLYRIYDDKVDGNQLICAALPPAFPRIESELQASPGGKVFVTRSLFAETNTQNNRVEVAYTYVFNLVGLNLSEGDSDFKFDNYRFGSYKFPNKALLFDFASAVAKPCTPNDETTMVVNTSTEGMLLQLPAGIFPTAETPENQPLEFRLSELHSLVFKKFTATDGPMAIDAKNVCNDAVIQDKLVVDENWKAIEGVVKITTTKNPKPNNPSEIQGYKHKITIENAVFAKEKARFTKVNMDFGTYIKNF